MIEIRNIQTIDGHKTCHLIKSDQTHTLDGTGLLLLPALIDPHVHFRTPGSEHKENWETGAQAAIAGGVTTVFDMPNNNPACTTAQRLIEKKGLIDRQLTIPLHYGLYLGADENHLDEIPKVKDQIVGLKIYMGSSTGDLVMHKPEALEKAFRIASENNVLIAVHAEDEELIRKRTYQSDDPRNHSLIRNPEVAMRAVHQAITLATKYKTRLYIAHVSTKEELDLIREAKNKGFSIYAEATPHHLFLTTKAYETLGTCALVNPPLREDNSALWEALHDGTIDTIGTDHAPHLLEEKQRPYGSAPSGFPSIELYLPLLLNAFHQRQISIKQIVRLTHTRPREIFHWGESDDIVLVDLNKKRTVTNTDLKSKAKWSPYAGMILTGWPRYTILKGKIYPIMN